MHREFSWPESMDHELQSIEQLEVGNAGQWLQSQRAKGLDDSAIHLLLALASARFVDHHGPFLGHGIFNGGPMLRAASLLPRPYRNLALLQQTAYVVDLLQQPNYGPYLLLEMLPFIEDTVEASRAQLCATIESGEHALEAEHRLVGLLKTDSAADVHRLLIEIALRQFHENEHRLLIVHRAAQLMDDTRGWTWVEPIFRPAVQYLGTHPIVRHPDIWDVPEDIVEWHGSVANIEAAVEQLIDADYGDETRMLREMLYLRLPLLEIISVTGAEMLCRSGFDAHAVTGIHCILDLLHDSAATPRVKALAVDAALLGQRTRRQKAQRSTWRQLLRPRPLQRTVDELRDIVAHDGSGFYAMEAAGGMLLAGVDATAIARTLMEVALTTSGPFDAIHNVKMLWGQLLETRRSRFPEISWKHLAAGARVVAETAKESTVDVAPIMSLWHSMELFKGH